MKKFFAFILALTMLLSLSVPAFADMDAPYFREYEVRIVNKDGAEIYRSEYRETDSSEYGEYIMKGVGVKIPYGEIVKIKGEYEHNGTLFLNVVYDEIWGYLKQSDTDIEVDVVSYDEGIKLETPRKVAIVGKGFYLYKGPSENYEKVGSEIKEGTVLTYEYTLSEGEYSPWAYFTHNGVSGWGEIYQYGTQINCANVVDDECGYNGDLYIFESGVRLSDLPMTPNPDYNDSKYVSKEIPVGTRLTFDWYYNDVKSIYAYVEYGGVKGWIETDCGYNGETLNKTAIGVTDAVYVWQDEGLPVYSKIGNKSSKVIATLEKGTLVKADYRCFREHEDLTEESNQFGYYPYVEESWYGVEVDGKIGWINVVKKADDKDCVSTFWSVLHFVTEDEDIGFYKGSSVDSGVISIIPAGSDVLRIGYKCISEEDEWHLIDYNGKIGWVDSDSLDDYYDEYSFKKYFSGKITSEYLEAVRTGKPLPTEPVTEETTQISTSAENETVSETLTEILGETLSETAGAEAETKNGMPPSQIAVFCAAGALVLAATAAVTIVLIKKKKKDN